MKKGAILPGTLAVAAALLFPAAAMAQARSRTSPATPVMVQNLPKSFKRIKPGMTKQQVWNALGLPPYGLGLSGAASGPRQAYASVYWVGPYSLGLVFDDSKTPSRLKSATLHHNDLTQHGRRMPAR